MHGCVFCAIVAGQAPATILYEWDDALAIRPRGGVNGGRALVIPGVHVADAVEHLEVTVCTVRRAAQYAAEIGDDLNLITSVGPHATQTVFHLHWHIFPRAKADDLMLPWTPQQAARAAEPSGSTS